MTVATVNGIRINFDDTGGPGEPVLLIMGSGGSGRAWHLHQVPALVSAGFRVITFDNRGIPPSDVCPEGFTIEDLVADTAGLIEHLDLGPCRIVGQSMGAHVAQELAVARPELVAQLVLMATRARTDALRGALARAELELDDSGVRLPAAYEAVVQAMQNLSPRTLNDDTLIRDWLDIFELTQTSGPGHRAQLGLDIMPDRRAAYQQISAPCRVIAFADDLISPVALGREVANTIPIADFEVISNCGHYGYLEDPAAVNQSIIEFFRLVAPVAKGAPA